jgi:hypothetical protein
MAWMGGALACALGAAMIGAEPGPLAAASVLYVLPTAGTAPALYLIASLGLGLTLARAIAPTARDTLALAVGMGLAAMLTITHLLGITGLLAHRWIAAAPVAVGIALLARSTPWLLAAARTAERPAWLWAAALPAAGVLLAAACSPPGWLWASEAGGYDALSYHLMLPAEWLAAGRVWPVEHNVYSFLPGMMEAAFVHTAVLSGVPRDDLAGGEGMGLLSAQLLHAGITLLAALPAAAFARRLLDGGDPAAVRLAPAAAGCLVIATPWSVVTGSLAYNEMAMMLLLFASAAAGADTAVAPARRWAIVGLLVGAACGCKPTALLMGAPFVGLVLMNTTPPRRVALAGAAGAVAGLAMLAPWLMRNWIAAGNPVFPHLTGLFGLGHWTAEQASRYADAHRFPGSIADAFRLLVMPDPADPASAPGRPVHRGLFHPQWALIGPLVIIGSVAGLLTRHTHRWSAVIIAGLAFQVAAWATLTHVQSRFLIPLLMPAAGLLALGLSACVARIRTAALAAGWVIAGAFSAWTVALFAGERPGSGPNALVGIGSPWYTNPALWEPNIGAGPVSIYLRARLPMGSRVLLVGEAAALYMPPGTGYSTVWDRSPLSAAANASPEQSAALLDALPATHVFVGLSELERLRRSGWLDPALGPEVIVGLLTAHAEPVHAFTYRRQDGSEATIGLLFALP